VSLRENVTLRFVEDKNGNIIDSFRASAIRKFSQEIWSGLGNIRKAPKNRGKVNAKVWQVNIELKCAGSFQNFGFVKGTGNLYSDI
jgi:hypothetical protein